MSSIDIPIPAIGGTLAEKQAPLRIVLYGGETLRVPRRVAHARVIQGSAWLTTGGKDIVLGPGEGMDLCRSRGGIVMSAVGGDPLLVQLESAQ
ncbi:MAG TPA: hypothetical protein VHE79_05915 [Spirochaetia bacterium]